MTQANKSPAESIWELGGLTPRQLGVRVWNEFWNDEILDRAAALAFYFLFALFPLMLFLMALIGFLAGADSQIRNELLGYAAQVLPPSAYDLIVRTLDETTQQTGGGKLTFGIVLTLWFASSGVVGAMAALNAAYGVREGRPVWKVRLTATLLTLAFGFLTISALFLILFGDTAAEWVAANTFLGSAFVTTWKILQFPLAIFFMVLTFAVMYYYAPDVDQQKWYWITPGSVVGVLLWIAVSLGFRIYLSYFDNYSATYGSLGAAIILVMWLYVTALAILVGGEINSEIEHAASERGQPEAKGEGEKVPEAA